MFKACGGEKRTDQEKQTEKPVAFHMGCYGTVVDLGVKSRQELWGHNGRGTGKAQEVFDG